MTVGLFVPCYIDQFYPGVARAVLEILERGGASVQVPEAQTCCGQPLANSGHETETFELMHRTASLFADCDRIVCPSGSCSYHIREHYEKVPQSEEIVHLRRNVREFCRFLDDYPEFIPDRIHFPYRTGLHQSCHGLRGLRLGRASELMEPDHSIPEDLLSRAEGIELCRLGRSDECCGFGGTFAVKQEALSVQMGADRLKDHMNAGVEVITGTDSSCLMHLEGLAKRRRMPLRFLHIAEILNSTGENR